MRKESGKYWETIKSGGGREEGGEDMYPCCVFSAKGEFGFCEV